MYDGGCFGLFTRWAVVLLIVFVLFMLVIRCGYVRTCTKATVY